MTFVETLVEKFPIRKNKKQKEAFRVWMLEKASEMGYRASADEKGYSRNVVIGDPETAKVTFTAHYDTPPRMFLPNMCTPTKPGIFILYQVLMTVLMLGVAVIAGVLAGTATGDFWVAYDVAYLVLLVLCGLMLFGPANPNCVNDNTSGVAAVLELMARVPAEERDKAAFILFDNEEKGLLGSMSYASKHKNVKNEKWIINMDCVGEGENMLFFANKRTRDMADYPKLEEAMKKQTGRTCIMNCSEKCIYPSDQANYKYGTAVCACSYSEKLGYYFAKIHTPKDTVCEQINLDYLANGLAELVHTL